MRGNRVRSVFYAMAVVAACLAHSFGAQAASLASLLAPKPDLWQRWTANNPSSTATIDHQRWTAFLSRYRQEYPDGIARLAYRAVSKNDRATMDAYIASLATTPISSYDRSEQLAYWINLYNALTVRVVLDHYPVKSIRDIDTSPGLFSDGPWGAVQLTIEGQAVTLNDIEHRILRPIWRDNRIHYALNCASIGCPNLMPIAFTATNASAMLDSGARTYINSPRGARVQNNRLITSQIYEWFDEDFGSSTAGIIAHLRKYAQGELAAKLATIRTVASYEYDWSLNDTPDNGASR